LALPKQIGFGLNTLGKRLDELSRLGYDDDGAVTVLPEGVDGDPGAVFDSAPHFTALLALVWLSRKMAGHPTMTFEESSATTPLSSLTLVTDDDDEATISVVEDPQVPLPVSGRGEADEHADEDLVAVSPV